MGIILRAFALALLFLGIQAQAQNFTAGSVTGAITTQNLVPTGTATTGSCVAVDMRDRGVVTVGVAGTYTGALSGQVTTDGSVWGTMAPTPFAPLTALGTPTATIISAAVGQWQVTGAAGFRQFRVCGLAAMTGTATITLNTSAASIGSSGGGGGGGGGAVTAADGSLATIGTTTDAVCGTDTGTCTALAVQKKIAANLTTVNTSINTATGAQTIANSNAVNIASDQMGTVAGASTATSRLPVSLPDGTAVSGSVASAATLFTQDMTGYESISVQVTSAGTSCTISYETSDDNTTWYLVPGYASISNQASAIVTSSNTANIFRFGKWGKYFRARVSTYGSGTVTVAGTLHKAPYQTLMAISTSGGLTVVGGAANSAARSGNPVAVSGQVKTAHDTTLAAGDQADAQQTTSGALVAKLFQVPDLDWTYAAAASGIANTTTAVTIKTAAAAGIRNYITGLCLQTATLGGATEFAIRDGAAGTVLFRTQLQTTALPMTCHTFNTPLKGTAATLLEIVTLTAVTGGVYANLQGYEAP